jgi:hypothetical protein
MTTNLSRTRFDVVRESELDMRCMVRDMTKRRRVREQLGKLQRRKRYGHKVDEVKLARLTTQTKKLSKLVLDRWGRLHRRMNREAVRKAEVDDIFKERREASGDSAHP